MHIVDFFRKGVKHPEMDRLPVDKHEALTLHLLVRLVKQIDERQEVMEERIKHVIDQNNRIIAILMPSQEP